MSDATGGRGGVGIRLYTDGGETVKRTFGQVGDSGKKMWAEIATGNRAANPALSALNTGAAQAKTGIGNLAAQANGGMSALTAFGTAGIATAAVLGAIALASAGFKDTLTWAADLNDASDKIGITAEALQSLHYAADETGVPLEALDAALQKLNGSLGAMQTGLGSGKVKAAFKELGINTDDLEGLQNASDLLPLIADRISKVDTVASRVQILKKLQIEDLEPLLRGGSLELARFTGEAATLGATLSNEVVDGLDDTERKLERNKQQIDGNVRAMQANLSPFFLWCSDWLATLARGFNDMLDRGKKVEERQDRTLSQRSIQLQDDVTSAYRMSARTGRPLQPWQRKLVEEQRGINAEIAARARARIADTGPSAAEAAAAAAKVRDDPETPTARSRGGVDGRTSSGSSARDAARRQADVDRAKAALDREEQRAQRDRIQLLYGGDSPAERAKLADELANLDKRERDASRLELRSDIIAAGASAEAADLQLSALRELDTQADALARQARDQVKRADLASAALAKDQDATASAIALLNVQGDLAKTEGERFAIARRILALQQELERKALRESLGRDGKIDASDQKAIDRLGVVQTGQALVFDTNEERRIRDTFKSAGRDIVDAIQDGRIGEYIGDQLKSRLLDGALDMLFNATHNTGGGVEGASFVSTGWNIAKTLFSNGGGRAGGGGANVGQMITTNEHGTPELFMLGGTGHVTNAAETAKMIKAMGGSKGGGSSSAPSVYQPLSFDLRGAVVTEDLLRQMQTMASNAGQHAVAQASDIARRSAVGLQQRQRRLGTS